MKARLDTALETWGRFSENEEDSPASPGRLCYDPANGIELELVDYPSAATLFAQGSASSPATLFGQLVDGTLVTLVDCFITNTSIGAGTGIGLPTKLCVNRALFGRHVADLEQLGVKKYSVELSSLANWMCVSPLKMNMPMTDGKRGIDATLRFPDPIHINLPEQEFDVAIAHKWNAREALLSFEVAWSAAVTISVHNSMTLGALTEVAWQCQNLMSMLIGDHLSVKSIAIKPVDPVSEGTIVSPLQLIYQQRGKHDHPDLHEAQMLLSYSLVKEQFPQIVAEWFARSEQAVLASNVFFGSQLHESPAIEVRFLAATQAAESYHRSLETGVYMEKSEYEAAIAGFVGQIPETIHGDHRVSLKKRLEWGYEYSFLKRLTDLLKRLPADVQSRIAGQVNASKFLAKVKDTRNYFTHLDHTSEQNALKGKDAFVACERLRILVVANLLHDLGIKDEILLSVLERSREFQHWMSQDLSL